MKCLISLSIIFILLLTSCSIPSSKENNQENSKSFRITSVRNISAGYIKAYYEDDLEESFSPPAVDDNDGFLEPNDLDLFIQKLEAITALDLIKNSGFKTKSISPAKELRKTQLLAQMESDERVRLFSDLDTLDSQLTTFTNEIDKLSQTRYFIGRPKGITTTPLTPTELFNQYKLKIDELKTEFDYLVESENTYSLVDAGANLAKQIQMYMFLIRDYADTKVADEVTNSQELTQFQDESDYFDKIQDTTTLIRFLQKNIFDSKAKIVSENDKLTIEYQRIDAEIALFNQGLIDVNNEIENIKTHLTPQEIEEVESEFQISSFSIQGARGKVLTELGKITIKYGEKGYKWGLRNAKALAKKLQKEIDDFLKEKDSKIKKECRGRPAKDNSTLEDIPSGSEIKIRTTRDDTTKAVEIKTPNGEKWDIDKDRVKKWVPEPKNPKTGERRVEWEKPFSTDPKKRTPTARERELLRNLTQ